MKLTLATAKGLCRDLGFTLIKRDGEYIVKPYGAIIDDPRTYFTDDIHDAIATAVAMNLEVKNAKVQ